jgi:hypothetical protein
LKTEQHSFLHVIITLKLECEICEEGTENGEWKDDIRLYRTPTIVDINDSTAMPMTWAMTHVPR